MATCHASRHSYHLGARYMAREPLILRGYSAGPSSEKHIAGTGVNSRASAGQAHSGSNLRQTL